MELAPLDLSLIDQDDGSSLGRVLVQLVLYLIRRG